MTDVFVKHPNDVLDYQKDWTDWLGADTISSSSWTVPTGLTQVSASFTTKTATVWLSGGVDLADYVIVHTIVTTLGRTANTGLIVQVRAFPSSVLTRAEGASVLRCEEDDPNLIDLLPLVDAYLLRATGHNWAADTIIQREAKAAARMLLVRWHEDPGGMAAGSALGQGLTAILTQLEALAFRYITFQGRSGAGGIRHSGAHLGYTVSSLLGKVGVTGDQSSVFESVISVEGEIQQLSTADLSDNWYQAYLIPPEAM